MILTGQFEFIGRFVKTERVISTTYLAAAPKSKSKSNAAINTSFFFFFFFFL